MPVFRKGASLYLVCLCVTGLMAGQAISQNAGGSNLAAIKAAYNQFRYAEVISLSLQSLTATPAPGTSEKVEIYTYLAFARISLGENDAARKDFEAALELDPALTLDPVYVSPKIIDLFNEVKLQMQAQEQEEPKARNVPDTYDMRRGAAWRSLVVPGWGQWHKNQKKKAVALFAMETVQIGALVYSHVKTGQYHDAYLEARDPADIETAYRKYNTFHKRRSYLIVSTAVLWLYAHVDAALHPPPVSSGQGRGASARVQPDLSGDFIGCRYVIDF